MSHVLFLAYRMSRGFGVDLVISQLAERLQKQNIPVSIGCMVTDGSYANFNPIIVPPNAASIRLLAQKLKCNVVVAHSSPFFEILPLLKNEYEVYVWEHGDPTPALRKDREASQRQKDYKRDFVYPNVKEVIAISKFIRRDIGWPEAKVIYNGCDHVVDRGPKPRDFFQRHSKIKIGGLMRLGVGESEYKGSAMLVELFTNLKNKFPVELHLMGRGTAEDAKLFRDNGFLVHLNASNEERDEYLRSLDIFVSTSLWEGFNLPLAEAQASGTLAMATNRGAHAEVCPLVFSDVKSAVTLVGKILKNRKKLFDYSRDSYLHVRQNFSWEKASREAIRILKLAPGAPKKNDGKTSLILNLWFRTQLVAYFLRTLGIRLFFSKVLKKVWK